MKRPLLNVSYYALSQRLYALTQINENLTNHYRHAFEPNENLLKVVKDEIRAIAKELHTRENED